jgi:PD-(D/E)XK nuclease superfamily protein
MTIRNGANVAAFWPRFLFAAKRSEVNMKHRKITGGRIKGTRERGAWAEMYFMVLAMSYGLRVSSPYGGLGPYDVGVENGAGRILRVQVKCTLYQCSTGSFCMSINMKKGARGRCGYAAGMVDFFAIYIIPTDDWYIIPYAVVGDRDANVFFKPGMKGQKYGEYREAWHLLVDACRGGADGPIDIQACCGEGDAGEGEVQSEVQRGRRKLVRKMFRTLFQARAPMSLGG